MIPMSFKIATEPWEFDEIHKLNYKTFVGEIPQHPSNRDEKLVDKFHNENVYHICVQDGRLVGMVAVRDKRPFSLDTKIKNLDEYLPACRSACEIRLLSVDPDCRGGPVLRHLLNKAVEFYIGKGYDLAVISGAVKKQKLYRHLGFVPFGPVVGSDDAPYQPMYLTLDAFNTKVPWLVGAVPDTINLMPGPVAVSSAVRRAFGSQPVSHRSMRFMEDMRCTKEMMCELVGARHVEFLVGSGTLANDAVGGQLTLLSAGGNKSSRQVAGLVLSNGEFGERLVDHATRFGLGFEVMRGEWGAPFDYGLVEKFLDDHPGLRWLWCVHCETSTGILNDLERLTRACTKRNVVLCADCISSVGTVPVKLQDVYLASCVSGKGLASFPGLAMVFTNHELVPPSKTIPRFLDLGYYSEKSGVPFTISSNMVYALRAALVHSHSSSTRFDAIAGISQRLRSELRERGFRILAPDVHASPAVLTIMLAKGIDSTTVGREMERHGCFLSFNSEYLASRNWIQMCLMGECERYDFKPVLDRLSAIALPGKA